MEMRYSAIWYLFASRSLITSLVIRQEPPVNQVILLDEHLRRFLAARVVLEVEPVEPVEGVIRAHVQGVLRVRSYPLRLMDSNTSRRLRNFPSR